PRLRFLGVWRAGGRGAGSQAGAPASGRHYQKKTPALPGFFFFASALDQAASFIVAMSITKR
ncbi:hypothetical protein, partial [Stenotrophomonas maltophilia]|uniref:hypothetical protein n=1 Tax=Stenotrophomonas maltophilia TaxID=40324 RepID=UPI002E79EB32